MRDVRLPDGTVVRGAALADREPVSEWREYGLYLDARWAPGWPAEVIDWPDLGIPPDLDTAGRAIHRAFLLAREGANVEVGCLGGLGRTGTAIACMAVLAGSGPDDAVAWVREHYARSAVETSAQERWVADFARHAAAHGWIDGGDADGRSSRHADPARGDEVADRT